MRITYLHQYFNTPEMPGSTRSFEMARRLVAWGHEVNMVTSWRRPDGHRGWFESTEEGIRVHWLALPYDNDMNYGDRVKAFLHFAWRSASRAASVPADVVFATSTPLTIALPGIYAARRRKVPMVLEVRDLWPEVPIALGALRNPLTIQAARLLERLAYRNARKIVALAPGMAESVILSGVGEERLSVIPNGCDTELFDAALQAPSVRATQDWLGPRPMVLYAGTLGLVNGVSYLADVAKALAHSVPEARVVVIGSGSESSDLREYARRVGVLERNFFMLGSKPKRETAAWIAAADITTSLIRNREFLWKNAVTNKFFDSIAAGKPIACNHPGWQTEIALGERVGILMDPEDPAAGAESLARVLRDPDWMSRARANARRLAQGRFSRDTLARQLESVLMDAIRAPRPA